MLKRLNVFLSLVMKRKKRLRPMMDFYFLWSDGTKKRPKVGEYYFNREWRGWGKKIITYILTDEGWLEID